MSFYIPANSNTNDHENILAKRLRRNNPVVRADCPTYTKSVLSDGRNNILTQSEKNQMFGAEEAFSRASDLYQSTFDENDTLQVSIASYQRDRMQFPSPSDFIMDLDVDLMRIKKMFIEHISFPNKIYNITPLNNRFYISEINDGEDSANFFVLTITPGYYTRISIMAAIDALWPSATYCHNVTSPGTPPATTPFIQTNPAFTFDTDSQQFLVTLATPLFTSHSKLFFHAPPLATGSQPYADIAKVSVVQNVTLSFPVAGNEQVDLITVTTIQVSNIADNARFSFYIQGVNGTVFQRSNIINTVSDSIACPSANIPARQFTFFLPVGDWPFYPNGSGEQVLKGTVSPDAAIANLGPSIGLYDSSSTGVPIPLLNIAEDGAGGNVLSTIHPHGMDATFTDIVVTYKAPSYTVTAPLSAGAGTSSTNKIIYLPASGIVPTIEMVRSGASVYSPRIFVPGHPMTLGSDKYFYIRVRVNGNTDIGHIINKNVGIRFLGKIRYLSGEVDVLFDNLNGIVTNELLKVVTPRVTSIRVSLYDDDGNFIELHPNQDWSFVLTFSGRQME